MKQAFNTFIAGPSGSGKSYEMGHDIEAAVLDDGFFTVLLDPKIGDSGQYGDHRGLSSGLDFVRLHCTKKVLKNTDLGWWKKLLTKIRADGSMGVRITFESLQRGIEEEMSLFIDTISRTILSMDGKILLGVEEAHNFAPEQGAGGSVKDIRGLLKLIDEGRKISKGAELSSQKLHKCHSSLYDTCQIYKLYPLPSTSDFQKVLDKTDHGDLIKKTKNLPIEARKRILYDRNEGTAELEDVEGLRRRTPHLS